MCDENPEEPQQEIKKVKKKPGRPRKSQPAQPNPKKGIVTTPEDLEHCIEFLYDKPAVFKKLLAFFKLMAVEKLHIIFTVKNIIIYCVDSHNKIFTRVEIDCSKVNHYYCKNEIDIGLMREKVGLIMATIDKNHNSILLLSTNTSFQRNIQIVLKNNVDIDENYKIELIGDYDKSSNENKFVDEDYMLKFKLTGKYFKKMISDIKKFSDTVTIKKDGPNEFLTFEFIGSDKKIKIDRICKNAKSISLVDNLGENDTFRTAFKIDYVSPVSTSFSDETIEIYADETKPLKFIINMDQAIQITILTNILDSRA
jgi:hypothetical protein